jgi:tripartite-type tricarboxylate transporter receptor subunit TctC
MVHRERRRFVAGLGTTLGAALGTGMGAGWGWSLGAVGGMLPGAAHAASDAWPGRPVTFIVPFPPGGPVDVTARFTAQPLGARWGVPAIVDNRAGAGGIVGAQLAARAEPDGHTFFFSSIHHAVRPTSANTPGYDFVKDFVPVGMAAVFPIVLVVHPSLPIKSVAELIAYAKANPGKLSYGSSGNGGGTHLAGELFNSMTGAKLQHIPYRGSAPAMQDLLGGQVQIMFADGPSAVPHVKAGKIRALGVGNPERSALAPDVPTIAESGLPGYEAYSWSGLVAPARTPPAIIARVNADLVSVLTDPATAKAMLAAGAEPKPGTPDAFEAFIKSEIDKWQKVIREANITLD